VVLLLLKLCVIPLTLLALGIVERLHGPRVAGWLTGFPVVALPMLVFITLDHGPQFGGGAALGSWFGCVPWLFFTATYAYVARDHGWPWATMVSFAVWGGVSFVVVMMSDASRWFALLPLLAFAAALRLYPRGPASDEEREHVWWGLPARMIAGAGLTVAISQFANHLGPHWSGIFSTFPLLGSVIAISNHVQYGRHAVQEAVAGMTMGLASVGVFCFAVYLLLGTMSNWAAFALALAACSATHALTWLLFKSPKAAEESV
jgi:hypothetical protein